MNQPLIPPTPSPHTSERPHSGPVPAGHNHHAHGLNAHSALTEPPHSAHRHAGHTHPAPASADAVHPALPWVAHRPSVLAWPAWLRVLSVLPVLLLLWLAVAWASVEVAPW